MKAIVLGGEPGKVSFVTDRPYPQPRPGYLIVEAKAVALNPADWKHVDFIQTENALLGLDFAGVVLETGIGYTKDWKKGDRICGFANGGNTRLGELGAFAERIVVRADVSMRIPDGMSFQEAATLGVGIMTCGQGLFQQMMFNLPSNPSKSGELVLVYGGSSATGAMAIQLLRLAGYTPLTTCSPNNFHFVKSLGAVEAFDYKDSDCADKIKSYAENNLRYIWDTISSTQSVELCAEIISSGGFYGCIVGNEFPRDDVKFSFSLGYTALGEPTHKRAFVKEDCTEDFEFAKKWITEAERILHQGSIKVHPYRASKGLENILDGLEILRQNKVSGEKLVYIV